MFSAKESDPTENNLIPKAINQPKYMIILAFLDSTDLCINSLCRLNNSFKERLYPWLAFNL